MMHFTKVNAFGLPLLGLCAALLLPVMTMSAPAMAQTDPIAETTPAPDAMPMESAENPDEDPSPVTLDPSSPEEQAEREAANRAQADMAQQQLQQNADSQQEYERRLESYNAQMRLYDNSVESRARANSQYDEIKSFYDRIRARWEADVAACNAGDTKRCAKTPPPAAQ